MTRNSHMLANIKMGKYTLFVDFKRAFDSIWHEGLFLKLIENKIGRFYDLTKSSSVLRWKGSPLWFWGEKGPPFGSQVKRVPLWSEGEKGPPFGPKMKRVPPLIRRWKGSPLWLSGKVKVRPFTFFGRPFFKVNFLDNYTSNEAQTQLKTLSMA